MLPSHLTVDGSLGSMVVSDFFAPGLVFLGSCCGRGVSDIKGLVRPTLPPKYLTSPRLWVFREHALWPLRPWFASLRVMFRQGCL